MPTDKFFEILKKQGLSFLLLGIAVWYFYTENKELRNEVRTLQSDVISKYQMDNVEMRKAIDRNTFVIETLINKKQ